MHYLKWIAFNFGLLTLLVIGHEYNVTGFETLSIILYWFFSIFSGLIILTPDVMEKVVKEYKDKPISNKYLNIIFDIGVCALLAFYGHPVTAFMWVLHLIFYLILYKEIKDS